MRDAEKNSTAATACSLPRKRGRVREGAVNNVPKQLEWHVTKIARARARSLRRDSTDAERIIWNALRAHRLGGVSFRRQTPIGPYVADFVCHTAKLVIEIDGGQHFEPAHMKHDARRAAYLSAKGFRTLRFNNYDVMTNRQGVLETIAAAIEASPSPPLPRLQGREPAAARGETRS